MPSLSLDRLRQFFFDSINRVSVKHTAAHLQSQAGRGSEFFTGVSTTEMTQCTSVIFMGGDQNPGSWFWNLDPEMQSTGPLLFFVPMGRPVGA